jgi:uncharacterized membrane protein YbhN (UPF0104 family)
VSAGVLWWTLRGVALAEVWAVLRQANAPLLLACTAVATAIFPLRARRWRTILAPVAGVLPFRVLWRGTAIGMMVNNVFPLRAGEFARALALVRQVPTVGAATALGSLAVDRLFDALVLLALLCAALLDPRFPDGVTIGGQGMGQLALGGLAVIGGAVAAAFLAARWPHRLVSLVRGGVRLIAPRLEGRVVLLATEATASLAVLADPRRFLAVFGWTLVHWLVHAASMHLGFVAVGIDLPLSASLFLMGVISFGVALPSSPGFFGVFEGAATVGLGVYGVPKELAISWALAYHLLSFIPITVLGALALAAVGLTPQELRAAPATPVPDAR